MKGVGHLLYHGTSAAKAMDKKSSLGGASNVIGGSPQSHVSFVTRALTSTKERWEHHKSISGNMASQVIYLSVIEHWLKQHTTIYQSVQMGTLVCVGGAAELKQAAIATRCHAASSDRPAQPRAQRCYTFLTQ